MKKILMLVFGIASLCIADRAVAAEPAEANVIAVKGYAELEVEPDIFYLNFTLQGDIRPIIDQREEVLDLLKRAKIDINNQLIISGIGTTSRRTSGGAYETIPTQSFRLQLPSTQQLQLLSSALEKMGIKSQYVSVDSSTKAENKRLVRIQAMQNAQEQAQILAEAVGCKAGRCIKIIDPNNRSAANNYGASLRAFKSDYVEYAEESEITASPNLKYEKIKITYSVEVEFMLDEGK